MSEDRDGDGHDHVLVVDGQAFSAGPWELALKSFETVREAVHNGTVTDVVLSEGIMILNGRNVGSAALADAPKMSPVIF